MSDHSTQFTIYDGLDILLRRKKVLVFTFLAITLMTIMVLMFSRDQYASEAKLNVKVGRESVGLDPTATLTGDIFGLNTTREPEINAVAELVRSRQVLEKTVDQIGVDRVLEVDEGNLLQNFKDQLGEVKSAIRNAIAPKEYALGPSEEGREDAIKKVNEDIKVTVPELSPVITIRGKAHSPELAQEMVASLVDHYLTEHMRSNRSNGSEEFFRQQSEELLEKLNGLRTQLNDRRTEDGIVSLDSQMTILDKNKTELERNLLTTIANEMASKAKIESIAAVVDTMQPTVVQQRMEGGLASASNGMRLKLYDLEIRERELVAQFRDTHPKVTAIRKQLADVKQILGESGVQHNSQTTYGINPAWQQLKTELMTEEANLAGLVATKDSVRNQLASVDAEVVNLNQRAPKYEDLNREIELSEVNYTKYSEGLEQSRIDSELQNNKITNVTVAQDATLVYRPVFPTKSLLAVLGLFLATCTALAMAFIVDQLDRSLKTTADVEQHLDVPVIISIPRTARPMVKL